MKLNVTTKLLFVTLIACCLSVFSFAENFNMELMDWARYGDCEAVAVDGNFLYAGNYAVLQTWDLSGEKAELVHEIECSGEIEDLIADNGRLFVKWENEGAIFTGGGVAVLDLTDPAAPELKENIELEFGSNGIGINNNNFYAITDSCFTYVYDVSDLNSVTKTGEMVYPDSIIALDIDFKGDYAFITAQSNGLLVYKLSDNSLVSHMTEGFEDRTVRLTIGGDKLYCSGYSGQLWVMNIADPANVAIEDTVVVSDGDYIVDIFHHEGVVFAANYDAENIAKIDFADPANPVITTIGTDHQPYRVVVFDGIVYAAGEEDGVAIVDVNFETDLYYVDAAAEMLEVKINEESKKAFVRTSEGSMMIFDWTNAYDIQKVYYTDAGDAWIDGFCPHGNYLFVSYDTVLKVLEIPDEINAFQQPAVVAEIPDLMSDPERISIDGNYMYVVEDDSANVTVFDITDPTSPVLHHTFDYGDNSGYEYDIEAKDGICVMAHYKQGISIWDVSDIANKNVELKYVVPCYKTYDVDIKDGNIYYANYGSNDPAGVRVITTNYGWDYASVAVDSGFSDDSFFGVATSKNTNFVFGAADDDALVMWEFDPEFNTPMETNHVGRFEGPQDWMNVAATSDGAIVFAANGDAGLVVINNTFVTPSSVDKEEKIVKNFKLEQNYPNPFNPTTVINYSLPKKVDVNISVYDMAGRKVSTLVNTNMNAGTHTINWDAGILASGVYFYKIKAGKFSNVKKCLLIK